MAQSTVRYRRHTLRNLSFYLLGYCFSAASSEEPDCRTYIGEETKEATGFAHRKKTPRWNLFTIVIPALSICTQPAP